MSEISHQLQPQMFPDDNARTHDYEQLVGHARTDGSYKTDEQLRSQYVELTDDLIYTITQGVEVNNPVTGERETKQPDYVVWLDKSARPVSWLTKELWDTLASDENGNIPKIPEFRYVNIDREQWINEIDPNGSGMLNINNINGSIIRSLRSVFVEPKYKKDGLNETVDEAPSELDGKTVLIVDEVQASGRTLAMAKQFFQRAFPDTTFATAHWMKGQIQKFVPGEGTVQGNADLPVWYKENDVTGRGVGNRDERLSQKSNSLTQRLGSWFLSTSLNTDDPRSTQLRRELHMLAEDTKHGRVLVNPSLQRDDFEERAVRLNGGIDFDTYIDKRNKLRDQIN